MRTQILGCPYCSQRFQVTEQQADQAVCCPGCAKTVKILPDVFETLDPSEELPVAWTPTETGDVLRCQFCHEKFRVLPELVGQLLACPHCQKIVNQGGPAAEQNEGPPDVGMPAKTNVGDSSEVPADELESAGKASIAESLLPPASSTVQPEPSPPESETGIESPAAALLRPSPSLKPPVETEPPTEKLPPHDRVEHSSGANEEATHSQSEQESQSPPVAGLLPPRFEIEDPARVQLKPTDEFKVYLPDADGGVRQFDQRLLHVEHDGKKVVLVAESEETVRRRRLLTNVISVAIGIGVLVWVFWLLTSQQ